MLENPVHYRDEMSKDAQQKLYTQVAPSMLYQTTGIQHLRLNGLFRLYAMCINNYTAYEKASTFLMIPDVLTYFLTGEMINEETNASTTQMLSVQTGNWGVSNARIARYQHKAFPASNTGKSPTVPAARRDTRWTSKAFGGGDARYCLRSCCGTNERGAVCLYL